MAARAKLKGNERGRGAKPAGQAARRRSTERRLLAAAERVFAERGFSGATTAEIARRARLPKANLHYYFRTKRALYRRVLDDILALWLAAGDHIHAGADPADAFSLYLARKIAYTRARPYASKVFANELLHGAPELGPYLRNGLKDWVDAKAKVIEGWIAEGRMARVDPRHLFFVLWAATQTYADFDVQVAAVLGRRRLRESDWAAATRTISRLLFDGCRIGP